MKNLLYLAFLLLAILACEKEETTELSENNPPVIKAQNFSASEAISDTKTIGMVKATDEDEDALSFSIAKNSDDFFEITNEGALSLVQGRNLDFATTSQHNLKVSVTDGTVSAEADITINVIKVDPENLAPEIENQTFDVAEDIPHTTVIGAVEATDPEEDNLTFTISENESDLFEITGNGELSLMEGQMLDFEEKEEHTITVNVSDGNNSTDATITIMVQNVNESPEFVSGLEFEVAEDIDDTYIIGTVVASDPENDQLIFSISKDENDLFEITESGELSLADGQSLDFETAQFHEIIMAVDDGVNESVTIPVMVNVTDIAEADPRDAAAFVTTWKTDNNMETIQIGVNDSFNYDYIINWGDGTIENITDSNNPEHTYDFAGIHVVAIIGDFPAIKMAGSFSDYDMASIDQWGSIQWQTMESAFASCYRMVYNATDVPDLSQVIDCSEMFSDASFFSGDLTGWDVSNITNMNSMFASCYRFNGNLSLWDVSNVTDMADMFRDCGEFNGDLSLWNVSNVTNMENMFMHTGLADGGIGAWDTGNVTNMAGMFFQNSDFNGDISNWDVGNVTSMRHMFTIAGSFNRDISGWDVSQVTDMGGMFSAASNFDQNLGAWNIQSVTNMYDILGAAMSFSTSNYDSTLIGWASQPNAPNNIDLGSVEAYYCAGATARSELINDKGWIIDDDKGLDPDCN